MDEREIIIADRDEDYRSQLADHFRKAGYRVDTTDSAAHVLCSILEKKTPVLLLGSDFDHKVSSVDLIHLLKKCNRHLNVIMVSDELPLAQARNIRQEGIFYHALKPAAACDTGELGMAVACAFENNRGAAVPQEQVKRRTPLDYLQLYEKGEQITASIQPLPVMIGLLALVFGSSCLALFAAETFVSGSSTALWCFLGFCALIITTQLLPIFRVKLPVSVRHEVPIEQEDSSPAKR
jgi:FixJ family two-component response regulator